MKQQDNLGDPLSEDFEKTQKPSSADNVPPQIRPGDDGLGIPSEAADGASVVPATGSIFEGEEEIDEELREEEFEARLAELYRFSRFLKVPGKLKKVLVLLLLAVAGACGVYVVSQTCSFLSNLDDITTSKTIRIVIAAAFSLFGALMLAAVLHLLYMVSRIKTSQSVNLAALTTLSERGHLQSIARKKAGEARKRLETYLESYPLAKESKRSLLHSGLKEEELKALVNARDRLLDKELPATDVEWLGEYKRTFQSTIDKASSRIIGRYSLKAGVATAASPVSFIDQAMVIFVCISMTKDLIRIYNLRPAAGQSLIMLSFSVINIYISGALEETTERFMESVAENVPGTIPGAFKTALGKASEGSLNGLLIWRLGRRVVSFLQPVR
jgi:uncharacterized membrane protein YcjF (UPF0283 family)